MKAIYLFALLAFLQNANAQDLCKEVKKEVSADKTQYDLFSPYSENSLPSVRVTRSVNTNPEQPFDNFFIIFRIVTGDVGNFYTKAADGSLVEKEEKTFTVEFEDKSKISVDTVQITHDFSDDKTEGIRTLFYPLTEQTLNDFSTKKIVKFSLGGYEKAYPADSANATMQYVKCIMNAIPKPQ